MVRQAHISRRCSRERIAESVVDDNRHLDIPRYPLRHSATTGREHEQGEGTAEKGGVRQARRTRSVPAGEAEDKRSVLLACISTLIEFLCAFALPLPRKDEETRQ